MLTSCAVILAGRTAVVTGGGRGIGAAIGARARGRGGARWWSRRAPRPRSSAWRPSSRGGGARGLGGRLRRHRPEQVRAPRRGGAQERLGARRHPGQQRRHRHLGAAQARSRLEDWNRVFAVNATGTFLCTQALRCPAWSSAAGGASSTSPRSPAAPARPTSPPTPPPSTRSSASPARVAAELAAARRHRQRRLPRLRRHGDDRASRSRASPARPARSREEALRAVLRRTSPQRRLIEPEEVAYLVVALCDDAGARRQRPGDRARRRSAAGVSAASCAPIEPPGFAGAPRGYSQRRARAGRRPAALRRRPDRLGRASSGSSATTSSRSSAARSTTCSPWCARPAARREHVARLTIYVTDRARVPGRPRRRRRGLPRASWAATTRRWRWSRSAACSSRAPGRDRSATGGRSRRA